MTMQRRDVPPGNKVIFLTFLPFLMKKKRMLNSLGGRSRSADVTDVEELCPLLPAARASVGRVSK